MNTADCSWSQEVAPVGQYSGSTMCKGLTIVYQALHLGVYVCMCVCVMDTNLSSSFLVETNTKILYLKWRYPSAAALNTAVKFFWLKKKNPSIQSDLRPHQPLTYLKHRFRDAE